MEGTKMAVNSPQKNATIKVRANNIEDPDEKEARLLAELEFLREQKQLTEKQKEEAESLAKIQTEKDKIYEFFKAHLGQTIPSELGSISLKAFENTVREVVSSEISKIQPLAGENLTMLVSDASSVLPAQSISTPNALKSLCTIIALGVATFIALMFFLSGQGSTSSSMQNMFNAFPLRFLINVLLVASSLGIAFCYCYFFHPEVWGYFHSKIKTKCTPQQDWNASPPQFRLQFVSDLFWKWALLFILAFLVIFV